jgi:hypothetical protein
MLGRHRFSAEKENGEAATQFLGAEGRHGMVQGATVLWPENGDARKTRAQVGQIGSHGRADQVR